MGAESSLRTALRPRVSAYFDRFLASTAAATRVGCWFWWSLNVSAWLLLP